MNLLLKPCGPPGVTEALMPLMMTQAMPSMDGVEQETMQKFLAGTVFEYTRHLEHIPLDILKAACDACVPESEFFPRVANIRKHADPALAKRHRQSARIDQLIRGKGQPVAPAFVADPAHVRLLMHLKWQEKPGSFLFNPKKADATRRELQALVNTELDAARAEERAPAEWTVGLENVAASVILETPADLAELAPRQAPNPERKPTITDVVEEHRDHHGPPGEKPPLPDDILEF